MQAGYHVRERVDGIVDDSAVASGMEVTRRSVDAELADVHASQTVVDGGRLRTEHARVRIENEIAGQKVAVLFEKTRKARRAQLLFALYHELDIDRQRTRSHGGLNRRDAGHDLTLVVCRTPRVEVVAAHDRPVGIGVPVAQRSRGLNIVVTVHEHGRGGRSGGQRLAVDRRVPGGGEHFDAGQPQSSEALGEPFGRALDVIVALGIAGDRRNAQKPAQFPKHLVSCLTCVIQRNGQGFRHM
jgi:hypothetical protein